MKYLILFLISFSTFAGMVKIAEFEAGDVKTFYVQECPGECIKVPNKLNLRYHVMVDETRDDVDNPVNSKSEIETCIDDVDCQAKLVAKICTDVDEIAIKNLDTMEVYCSKFLYYPQIPTGEKIIVVDPGLKAIYNAEKQAEKDQAKLDRDAKKAAKAYFKSIDCSLLSTQFEINACVILGR